MFLFSGSAEPWFHRKPGHEKILCTLGSFSLKGNRQEMHLYGATIKNSCFWNECGLGEYCSHCTGNELTHQQAINPLAEASKRHSSEQVPMTYKRANLAGPTMETWSGCRTQECPPHHLYPSQLLIESLENMKKPTPHPARTTHQPLKAMGRGHVCFLHPEDS